MAKFICKNCGEPFDFFVQYAPFMPPDCPNCKSRFTEIIGPDNMIGAPPIRPISEVDIPGTV